jgi:fatty acid desaturase
MMTSAARTPHTGLPGKTYVNKDAQQTALNAMKVFNVTGPLPSVAWPTFLLFFGAAAAHLLCSWLFTQSCITTWTVVALNTWFTFLIFTPMHDAAHGSIATSSSGLAWINNTIGFLAAVFFAGPFFAFRYATPPRCWLHVSHHLSALFSFDAVYTAYSTVGI